MRALCPHLHITAVLVGGTKSHERARDQVTDEQAKRDRRAHDERALGSDHAREPVTTLPVVRNVVNCEVIDGDADTYDTVISRVGLNETWRRLEGPDC